MCERRFFWKFLEGGLMTNMCKDLKFENMENKNTYDN